MTNELTHIEALLRDCKTHEAIALLNDLIPLASTHDKALAYYLLGNAYRKLNDWRNAINNYCLAMELDPDGPASQAYHAAIDVLNFFNHDLYNP